MVDDSKSLGLSGFGVASFLKAPIVDLDDDWSADVAFLGIPFDRATGFRPGTRFGHRAIRDISMRLSSLLAGGRPGSFDLRSGLTRATCGFVDGGDVDILPLLWERNFDLMTQAVATMLAKCAFPLIVGGPFRQFSGNPRLCRARADNGRSIRRASGLSRRCGRRALRPWQRAAPGSRIAVRRAGRRTRYPRPAHAPRGPRCPCRARQRAGPDLGHPCQGPRRNCRSAAAKPQRLRDLRYRRAGARDCPRHRHAGGRGLELRAGPLEPIVAGNRLVGFDMVEVNPSLDVSQITALLALQIMVEAVGLVFSR